MANRTYDNVQALNKEVKVISGQITCTALQNPGPATFNSAWGTNQGLGFVADSTLADGQVAIYLGTGAVTVPGAGPDEGFAPDTYTGLLSVTTNSIATVADSYQTIRAEDVANLTLPIVTLQNFVDVAGTPTLAEFAVGDIIFFTLVLRNSSVQ